MRKLLVIIVIAIPVLAIAVPLTLGPGSSYDVKQRVSTGLVDPNSAIFDGIEFGDFKACGFVNAKNRMGGYVGRKRFVTYRYAPDNNPVFTDFEPGEDGVLSKYFEEDWGNCQTQNPSLFEDYKRAWAMWLDQMLNNT